MGNTDPSGFHSRSDCISLEESHIERLWRRDNEGLSLDTASALPLDRKTVDPKILGTPSRLLWFVTFIQAAETRGGGFRMLAFNSYFRNTAAFLTAGLGQAVWSRRWREMHLALRYSWVRDLSSAGYKAPPDGTLLIQRQCRPRDAQRQDRPRDVESNLSTLILLHLGWETLDKPEVKGNFQRVNPGVFPHEAGLFPLEDRYEDPERCLSV